MTVKYLPVRTAVKNCFKNFSWASEEQKETLWNYVDHLLAGRGEGRKALLRAGMTNLTDRQLTYQLKHVGYYLEYFKKSQKKYITNIDRRRIHQLAFDDTNEPRTGKKVFATSYQYNHSTSSVEWGQTIVDLAVVAGHVLTVDYKPYIPQQYIDRVNRWEIDFKTKIELVQELFSKHIARLKRLGLSTNKIWVSVDCWYPSEPLTYSFRHEGVNFAQSLKKNACCHLFGMTKRLDEVFRPDDRWHYLTDPRSGNIVWYQEKILNLTRHGKCKVFAVRRGNDRRIRYYATNRLKMSFQRFLPRLRDHWQVETLHHDLKEYFNLCSCYSGDETLNHVHWQLCYLLYLMFRDYQYQQLKQGVSITLPQLIELYRYQYDEERSRNCFSSPTKRHRSKMALLGGLC